MIITKFYFYPSRRLCLVIIKAKSHLLGKKKILMWFIHRRITSPQETPFSIQLELWSFKRSILADCFRGCTALELEFWLFHEYSFSVIPRYKLFKHWQKDRLPCCQSSARVRKLGTVLFRYSHLEFLNSSAGTQSALSRKTLPEYFLLFLLESFLFYLFYIYYFILSWSFFIV